GRHRVVPVLADNLGNAGEIGAEVDAHGIRQNLGLVERFSSAASKVQSIITRAPPSVIAAIGSCGACCLLDGRAGRSWSRETWLASLGRRLQLSGLGILGGGGQPVIRIRLLSFLRGR